MRTLHTLTKWKRCLCLGLAVWMILLALTACGPGNTVSSSSVESPESTNEPGGEPTPGGDESPTGSEEPALSSEEPTSGGEEPVSSQEEPASSSEEPVSGHEEPSSSSEEPVYSSEEPSSSSEEPISSSEEPSSGSEEPSSSSEEPSSSSEEPKEPEPGTRKYIEKYAYLCTVKADNRIVPTLYTDGKTVPDEISDLYYSTRGPGGEPTRENGEVWLCLKPGKGYSISTVSVEGTYTQIVNKGRDVYLIRGVNSNLTVTAKSKLTPASPTGSTLFANYGYGITDNGRLHLTWIENDEEPIRYVEVSISDGSGTRSKLYDGARGECDFMKLEKNEFVTVKMKSYGYKHVGAEVSVTTCYIPDARSVAFPRVEITTEGYIWPTCEYVGAPAGNWGGGIRNATWENSVVKIFDASNQVVYDSSLEYTEEEQFQGAKMKIRGNTSAYGVKKPYKIKLSKKKDLLAPFINRPADGKSYADKEWLLLNYGTDIYRVAGEAVADVVGTPWSPDYTYVALYVNGDYRGLYVLSECVKQGTGSGDAQWRCPVDDDGFIIEGDAYWWNEPIYFTTPSTENIPMKYTFKYPDTDDFDQNSECYLYIKNYMTQLEAALARNDSSYLNYIDLESFVQWILVEDYLCIYDSGGSNIYMWKKDSTENSKLVMGPNWDFDSWKYNTNCFARIRWNGSHFYYPQLFQKQEFVNAYNTMFRQTYKKVAKAVNEALDRIDETGYNQLYRLEGRRYQSGYTTLTAMRDSFNTWIQAHLNWMVSQIGT